MTPRSIASAPGALPLFGHAVPLLRDPLRFLSSLPRFGDLVQIRLGPAKAVVVCDPELLRQVLRDDHTFDKGGPFFDRVREMLGDGLATCPHSRHRRQRRLLQPAFHAARFPGYARAMTEQTMAVTASWHDNQVVDVLADMMTITSRTLAVTMFSDTVPTPTLRQAVDDIFTLAAGTYRRLLMPPPLDRLPTAANRRYHRARSRLRRTMSGVLADRRASGTDHGDLLSAMLATGDSEPGMSDSEVVDNLMTFVLAGSESTSSTLAWSMHLLAEHPDIHGRLRAEVDAVLGGSPATLDHLPKLALTSRVVTEVLRLYPPGWMFTRTVTAPTRLGRHLLRAGTAVLYSPYLIHHRGDRYHEPDRFNPDRWTDPHPHSSSYLPFGSGARKCIGDRFSRTEAILTIATIATHWQLKPLPHQQVRAGLGLALHPRNLRMRTVLRAGTATEPEYSDTPSGPAR